MKNQIQIKAWLLIMVACLTVVLQLSCKKNLDAKQPAATPPANSKLRTTATNAELIAYKNTKHEISAGFYRIQGPCYGPGASGSNITQVPDSLDILILFCFDKSSPIISSIPGWINALHAKGTKVIMTGGLDIPSGVPHTTAGYQTTAKLIMDSVVNKYNLDGYDIDVESTPSGSQLTDMTGVYTALSAYLGPKSGTGKLLTFDTNQEGTNSLFRKVYTMIDYVWLQAYGRGASSLQSTWNSFSPYITSDKFIPGFSFYEENGYPSNVWYDVTYPQNGTGRAYDYARWEPTTGKKGGVFGYAIDRDAPLTSSTDNVLRAPNYKVTKDLIKIMNPTGGGTTPPTTDGVIFYQDSNYGGTASQKLAKGTYTLAQLVAKGVVNDWASSAKIPTGWTVIMYADDNFTGTSWTLTSSNTWFGALSPTANDKVSSIKIQ